MSSPLDTLPISLRPKAEAREREFALPISFRHILPQRMHDQEKGYSPPLRALGGYSRKPEESMAGGGLSCEEYGKIFPSISGAPALSLESRNGCGTASVPLLTPAEQEPTKPQDRGNDRKGNRDGGTIRYQNYDVKGRPK